MSDHGNGIAVSIIFDLKLDLISAFNRIPSHHADAAWAIEVYDIAQLQEAVNVAQIDEIIPHFIVLLCAGNLVFDFLSGSAVFYGRGYACDRALLAQYQLDGGDFVFADFVVVSFGCFVYDVHRASTKQNNSYDHGNETNTDYRQDKGQPAFFIFGSNGRRGILLLILRLGLVWLRLRSRLLRLRWCLLGRLLLCPAGSAELHSIAKLCAAAYAKFCHGFPPKETIVSYNDLRKCDMGINASGMMLIIMGVRIRTVLPAP